MEESSGFERKISEIEAELANLDHHRDQLFDELTPLRRQLLRKDSPAQLLLHLQGISINNQSSQEEKIRLFRSLFKGREDMFSRRFENSKTGKSGYAPVCRNEWQSGICQKPKIACQECNFCAFVPISDEIIRYHLMGKDPQERAAKNYTLGVYPLLADETCWFLVVDFDKSTWAEDARAFAVHFLVMSSVAKYNNFRAAWGLGNEDLFLITVRNWRYAKNTLRLIAFRGIGGVDQSADLQRELKEGGQLLPVVDQTV